MTMVNRLLLGIAVFLVGCSGIEYPNAHYVIEYHRVNYGIHYFYSDEAPVPKDGFVSFYDIATQQHITISGDIFVYEYKKD